MAQMTNERANIPSKRSRHAETAGLVLSAVGVALLIATSKIGSVALQWAAATGGLSLFFAGLAVMRVARRR